MNQTVYIISYDISQNKQRNKIYNLLESHAWERIQYSVWMKRTTRSNIEQILPQLKTHIDYNQGDSVYFFSLPPTMTELLLDNHRLKHYLSSEYEQLFY